jgi:hypothetical protein
MDGSEVPPWKRDDEALLALVGEAAEALEGSDRAGLSSVISRMIPIALHGNGWLKNTATARTGPDAAARVAELVVAFSTWIENRRSLGENVFAAYLARIASGEIRVGPKDFFFRQQTNFGSYLVRHPALTARETAARYVRRACTSYELTEGGWRPVRPGPARARRVRRLLSTYVSSQPTFKLEARHAEAEDGLRSWRPTASGEPAILEVFARLMDTLGEVFPIESDLLIRLIVPPSREVTSDGATLEADAPQKSAPRTPARRGDRFARYVEDRALGPDSWRLAGSDDRLVRRVRVLRVDGEVPPRFEITAAMQANESAALDETLRAGLRDLPGLHGLFDRLRRMQGGAHPVAQATIDELTGTGS